MDKFGFSEALERVERIQQVSAANHQLLVMLEVVREWGRADAVDLQEAARHAEVATTALGRASSAEIPTDAIAKALHQVDETGRKLDRLNSMAPLRATDPAVVSVLLDGVQKLRAANELARAALRAAVSGSSADSK